MKNRPQMIKDLADMSARLNSANTRVAELESASKDTSLALEVKKLSSEVKRLESELEKKPKVVKETVRVEVPVIKYQRDLNKEKSLQAEIDRLNTELSKKPRVEIVKEVKTEYTTKEVDVPVVRVERVTERVEVPVIKYKRNLTKEKELNKEIKRLQSELSKKPKTVIVKEKPEVVTNATQKTVVEYYKCPQQSAVIASLRARLANG